MRSLARSILPTAPSTIRQVAPGLLPFLITGSARRRRARKRQPNPYNPAAMKKTSMHRPITRRCLLKQSAPLVLSGVAPRVAVAQTPPASAPTPELVAAAEKEGRVVWYTSVDLPVAEKIARAFEVKHPAISVRVERNGSERLFQRLEPELGRGHHAGDLGNTSDAAHFQ